VPVLPGASQPFTGRKALEWPKLDHVFILENLCRTAAARVAVIFEDRALANATKPSPYVVGLHPVALDFCASIKRLVKRRPPIRRVVAADIARRHDELNLSILVGIHVLQFIGPRRDTQEDADSGDGSHYGGVADDLAALTKSVHDPEPPLALRWATIVTLRLNPRWGRHSEIVQASDWEFPTRVWRST
jgi:hypothetical protein